MLEEKAKRIAAESHKGQCRKDRITPYITHPKAVVELLKSIGVNDENILCAAWLHDTIEDCGMTGKFIKKEFNQNIARMVQSLSRDINREKYKKRIGDADYAVQIIKLADTVHNCATLSKSLPEKTIKRKLKDCKLFYLPLSKKIAPEFYKLLVKYLSPWKNYHAAK